MDIYYNIIYLVSNLFRIYVIYRFAGIFFRRETMGKKWEIILYLLYFVVTSGVNLEFHMPVLNLIINIVGLLAVFYLYTDTFMKKVVSVGLIYIINMAADVVVVFVLGNYFTDIWFQGINNIILSLFIFILELVVERIVSDKKEYRFAMIQGIPLLAIPIISIIMIIMLVYHITNNKILIVMESIFILLINIVAFYLYDWIIQSYAEKYEKELLERQLECYTNQIRIIELSQSKIKSLQHDIKHHFLQLGDMATKNDNEEILRYLEEMKLSIKNTMEYVSTGNAGIDTILNYMIGEAKKLTDNVMVKVQIPEHIILNQFDINVILSNLLENAISALREVEDKKLNITIKYDKGTLYILIQNNYRGVIKNRYGNLITSKDNNEFHGIGLSNVQKMVDKYNGILNIEYDDLFTAEVLLYLTL